MSTILQIGSTDVTKYIVAGGYSWEKNDIDAPNSGRDMNGTMRRSRIVSKDKIQVTCRQLSNSELQTLAAALEPETVSVRYLNPQTGTIRQSTFYSSKINGAIVMDFGTHVMYEGVKFDLVEV